ncbi:MAG: hypothetical protein OXE51_02940, partial [Gammaproteobacteria bacterium]|nr:hypothetical protein [Gammaproteobacteria bacterium]
AATSLSPTLPEEEDDKKGYSCSFAYSDRGAFLMPSFQEALCAPSYWRPLARFRHPGFNAPEKKASGRHRRSRLDWGMEG